MGKDSGVFRERDFAFLVTNALASIPSIESIEREPILLSPARPDFVARLRNGHDAIIEVKVVTPATTVRLDQAINQLQKYKATYHDKIGGSPPELILVVPGVLAPEHIAHLVAGGIDLVLDGPALRAAAPDLPWPTMVAGEKSIPADDAGATGRRLAHELQQISPGRASWAQYQRVVRDILAATLCPPLEQPLDERSNLSGVNRRDIIFPNYAVDGFWKFIRDHYEAYFVVVEAKNYLGGVKKKEILQIANYLSAHGPGLFGIVACRNAADRSAEVTRREQWVIYQKMIIVLNDDDLRQMLSLLSNGDNPGTVIRQKIEDFRLEF